MGLNDERDFEWAFVYLGSNCRDGIWPLPPNLNVSNGSIRGFIYLLEWYRYVHLICEPVLWLSISEAHVDECMIQSATGVVWASGLVAFNLCLLDHLKHLKRLEMMFEIWKFSDVSRDLLVFFERQIGKSERESGGENFGYRFLHYVCTSSRLLLVTSLVMIVPFWRFHKTERKKHTPSRQMLYSCDPELFLKISTHDVIERKLRKGTSAHIQSGIAYFVAVFVCICGFDIKR